MAKEISLNIESISSTLVRFKRNPYILVEQGSLQLVLVSTEPYRGGDSFKLNIWKYGPILHDWHGGKKGQRMCYRAYAVQKYSVF